MSTRHEVNAWVAEQLPRLATQFQVPGAAVAILAEGEVGEAAHGVLSQDTQVAVTTDALFQIGSITKLWTATLVLQLADEGLLDLEAPVRRYLPEFAIADESAATAITVHQLLDHTSGFEGDIFTDTGVGDDCVEKFLGVLADVPQLFPPGRQFSYNNAGYCVLGRLVEVLRGKTYDQCLREHLFAPLGLKHVAASAYEALLFRTAVGHIEVEPGAGYHPAPFWAMARSNSPAGSMLSMRAADLIAFARMHLEDGRATDGTPVLAPGTAARMQEKQVELPELGLMGTSWGLGFERFDLPGATLVGHDGNTIGQSAFLRMVPGTGVAVALLTNGGDALGLHRALFTHILAELAGITLPDLPAPPAESLRIDATRYTGTYSAQVYDLTVTQDGDGRIWLEQKPRGLLADLGEQSERREMLPYRGDSLIPAEPMQGMYLPHVFLGDDGAGHAQYLHVGRAVRRATSQEALR
jgi:CubicO group peptidase (beta-lactamase class C family)